MKRPRENVHFWTVASSKMAMLLARGLNMQTSQTLDHKAHAKQLRDRAKECRSLASLMEDDVGRNAYLDLASAYDILAAEEELMCPRISLRPGR